MTVCNDDIARNIQKSLKQNKRLSILHRGRTRNKNIRKRKSRPINSRLDGKKRIQIKKNQKMSQLLLACLFQQADHYC